MEPDTVSIVAESEGGEDYDDLTSLPIEEATRVFDAVLQNVVFSCDAQRMSMPSMDLSAINFSTMTTMFKTTLSDVRDAAMDAIDPKNQRAKADVLTSFSNVGKHLYDAWMDPDKRSIMEDLSLCPEGFHIPDKRFVNSTIVKYHKEGQNRKAIKVFSNGKLHITGARSAGEALDDAQIISRIIDVAMDLEDGTVKPTQFELQMLNSNFKGEIALNLDTLRSLLEREYPGQAHAPKYDKEHHAAVRFQYRPAKTFLAPKGRKHMAPAEVTVLMFMSGCVLMTGVKHPIHVKESYRFVSTILAKHADELRVTNYVGTKRKKSSSDVGASIVRKKKDTDDSFYDMFKL